MKLAALASICISKSASRAFVKNSGEFDKSGYRNRPPEGRWPDMRQRRPTYDAEKARGGEVVLRTRWERVVFIAGLIGAVAPGLVLAISSFWP